jgi:hypothetical protein
MMLLPKLRHKKKYNNNKQLKKRKHNERTKYDIKQRQ